MSNSVVRFHFEGVTVEEFVNVYLNGLGQMMGGLDRQVVDKTGLAGKFDVRIEHARTINQRLPNAPPKKPTEPVHRFSLRCQSSLD